MQRPTASRPPAAFHPDQRIPGRRAKEILAGAGYDGTVALPPG